MPLTSTPESATAAIPPNLELFHEHWQDEGDAAYLYDILATLENDTHKQDVYRKLADVERRHLSIWGDLLAQHQAAPQSFKPSARARVLAIVGRRLGPGALLPLLLREEGREVKAYLDMHRETPTGAAGGNESLTLAKESAEHATELAKISGKATAGEPWHRAESGGMLRNVVYGFNDGLTANFGLLAGVLGATATQQHAAVVVAGVAGLVADALSMGSSGYLAAKSEQEVYAYEISMERDEIALMPEIERDELALIYETKGMAPEAAHALASEVMRDPERMLKEKVQEELGIAAEHQSPMREGWITGFSTAVGALIPVLPFFLLRGTPAIVLAFSVSMLAHFVIGAARSVFTGRGLFRSGLDMFVVGLGVAAVGYFAGNWISGWFI